MREIQAISKLYHKNIVRYQGCWVEADEPDEVKLKKILKKSRRSFNVGGISEDQQDDSEFEMKMELEDEV